MKKNNKIYYWICDDSQNTGEGRLSFFFLNDLKKKYKILKIKDKKSKFSIVNNFYNLKYIIPFRGVYYCWKYYLNDFNVGYINYLPFWNFLIFFLLPPNTIIGPITGGSNYKSKMNIIRYIIFPIFFKISEFIINYRNFNIIFSTDLLKKNLSNITIKKSQFNYILNKFNKKNKKVKKSIDFIIYYRNHRNKKNLFQFSLIKKLVYLNYKVHVVGDTLNYNKIFNHGYLDNKKVQKLQAKTKYSIVSNENIYSLFILECISNNVKIFIDKKFFSKISFFKKKFIILNLKKFEKRLY